VIPADDPRARMALFGGNDRLKDGDPGANRYTSVASAISRASSTSIPRYRTVALQFVTSRSWTALRFFVRR